MANEKLFRGGISISEHAQKKKKLGKNPPSPPTPQKYQLSSLTSSSSSTPRSPRSTLERKRPSLGSPSSEQSFGDAEDFCWSSEPLPTSIPKTWTDAGFEEKRSKAAATFVEDNLPTGAAIGMTAPVVPSPNDPATASSAKRSRCGMKSMRDHSGSFVHGEGACLSS